ncbi:MAG: nucleotidyltransferase family protein [Syntrophomonas sp.]
MCEGLIAAAGKSQRTSPCYKMELDFDGKTLLEKCLESMMPFCSRVLIVGGHNIDILRGRLAGYPKVEVINNLQFEKGMFSSIQEGARHIRAGRFFFLPGDYPCVSPEVYRQMLACHSDVVVPVYGNRSGHPVLINSSLIRELLEGGYNSLRDFMAGRKAIRIDVDCPGILLDVDTLEDYQKALDMTLKRRSKGGIQ